MEPVDLMSGWDLRRPVDRKKALEYIRREKPEVIVAAWPCTKFSQMQNLNVRHPGYVEKLQH